MTKSHNPQFGDDETRYVRYVPCLCFRFLQTCQYLTYVVLLACVIYFFSVTSWHPSTSSSTSGTPEKHPHSPYRPKPNRFRPFGLRMKQSHGYHRSTFHKKGVFSGNGFNQWMRKNIKSKVFPFTVDDVPVFPTKNLKVQGRKSHNNRQVSPLDSGRQYKYAGTDRKALDIIHIMFTKSPKRLTGTPSLTRLIQTEKGKEPSNGGKAITIKTRTRLSTQSLTERGLQGGPKRTKGHVHFDETETKKSRVMSQSKSENGQLDTGKLSSNQNNAAVKLPTVEKDGVKKGVMSENRVAYEKVETKKIHTNKVTSKRLIRKSDKKVFSDQPRVIVKNIKVRGKKHKETHPLPSQGNLKKFDLLHDTKVIPKTPELKQGPVTSIRRNLNGGSVGSVQTRLDKLKLRGPSGRFPAPRADDRIKPQPKRSRIIRVNKTEIGLLKETQQAGKHGRPYNVGKLKLADKGPLGRWGNSSRSVNESKLHGAKNEDNSGLSKVIVRKKTLTIPKHGNATNDRTKQQKRHVDPRHVVRGKGHKIPQGHRDVRPHNKEIRQAEVRGRQVIRGEGHNVARGHYDVRPRDVRRRAAVKGHGDVRGQGRGSAQTQAGVRRHHKVRSQERLQGHDSARGQDSVRGHVDLQGHEGSRVHAGQRGHTDTQSQDHVGTNVNRSQQAKPTGTKYTGDKRESNPKRSMMRRLFR